MQRFLLSVSAMLLALGGVLAQADFEAIALQHALKSADQAAYSPEDLNSLAVDYSYTDSKLGITYVYLKQQVGQLPIEGASATVALSNGKVYSFRERFISDVAGKLTSVVPSKSDLDAIQVAANSIGEQAPAALSRAAQQTGPQGQRMYAQPAFAHSPIAVNDYFILGDDEKLHRAIGVEIDSKGESHYVHISVDAVTGKVLATKKLTVECAFDHDFLAPVHTGACDVLPSHIASSNSFETSSAVNDGSSYRVFAWPAESPNHGPHVIVQNPADSVASPFGWHDTNGAPGAEFTITQGNNAHAYVDGLDDDSPSVAEPDGGSTLTFDFPYDVDKEPIEQLNTTTTNLFYTVNLMHDFVAAYGFDEPAGNFQQLNYSGQGRGGDYVLAQSEDGAVIFNNAPDADHINNANFSTPGDGSNGRMQMYLWNANNIGNAVNITSPAFLVGTDIGDPSPVSDWGVGASIDTSTNIVAGAVTVDDGVRNQSTSDGCEPILNASELQGKIALIDRGTCEFGAKALRAQNAGAAAVIICNFEEATIPMGPGADGGDVNIPVFMLPLSGCQRIRVLAEQNADFQITIKSPDDRPTEYVSGSFDNGIVAHEYGHGISTRLTGGPNVSCLGSAEQMGEGWSDFFSLVTSVNPGDIGSTPRGIGTFAQRESTRGPGIRPFPYSTDMSVNPVTYQGVANSGTFSQPHGIGSIWCSMLWDLYWNMVDEYGWSADLIHGNAGNNKAILLVMTGLKLQPCSPGFADGRDAILDADRILSDNPNSGYGDSNAKLIWETFARRGLGSEADQGDPDDRFDGVVDFTIPPVLANTVYFNKEVTPTIAPGGQVDVQLIYANWLNAAVPTATITDEIPAGSSLISSSVSQPFTQNGDVLSFDFQNVSKGDTILVEYSYMAPSAEPTLFYYQPILSDDEESDWESESVTVNGSTFWEITEEFGYQDNASWWVEGSNLENQPFLAMTQEQELTVSGTNPVFTFWTQYQLDLNHEGGIVEYFSEDEQRWVVFEEDIFLRNGYDAELIYNAFVIPFLDGFGGNVTEWRQVIMDMSDFAGQTIRMRWRYGRRLDPAGTAVAQEGWYIDEMKGVDAIMYNTEATLATGVLEPISVKAPNVGTYVESGNAVNSINEVVEGDLGLRAFPNPTSSNVSLYWRGGLESGTVRVFSATGQLVRTVAVGANAEQLELDFTDLASGLYSLRTERGGIAQSIRIIKQ